MRYDFTKIQEAIHEAGMTLREAQEASGVHYVTIQRALKTGQARQSTALALTKTFKVPMKAIQVQARMDKTA